MSRTTVTIILGALGVVATVIAVVRGKRERKLMAENQRIIHETTETLAQVLENMKDSREVTENTIRTIEETERLMSKLDQKKIEEVVVNVDDEWRKKCGFGLYDQIFENNTKIPRNDGKQGFVEMEDGKMTDKVMELKPEVAITDELIKATKEAKFLRDMVYDGKDNDRLLYLHEDKDTDTALAIINIRGSHPCAYVKIAEERYQQAVEQDLEVDDYDTFGIGMVNKDDSIGNYIGVHGGITFSNYGQPNRELAQQKVLPDGFWFGWDYAHAGDFTQPFDVDGDLAKSFGAFRLHEDVEKKWTTLEVLAEAWPVYQAIREGKYYFEEKEENSND